VTSVTTKIKPDYEPKARKDGGWIVCDTFLPRCNLDTALLFGFRNAENPKQKEYFFWRIADVWWNSDPTDKRFARHKWSNLIISKCCRHDYLAVGGAASSGKSYVLAGWALVCWMSNPSDTKVLLTSTHLGGARDRIWGAVMRLIDGIPNPPCKIRDSIGSIAYYDGNKVYGDAGLKLVSADRSQNKHKIGKMIGSKAKNVILVADEQGEISESIQEAATSNLATNPNFQMIGLSNPSSRFDPFGVFCEPKDGWDSINVEIDMEWTTRIGGRYIRLDAYDSPNFDLDADEEPYEYLPSQRTIDNALDALGDDREAASKSRGFLRMFRAVFFDSDEAETVYTETELHRAGALSKTKLTQSVHVAGLDPSYSSGGDATALAFGEVGYDTYGQYCMQINEIVLIHADETDKTRPRNLQIAEKVRHECDKRKVLLENLAVDATGAGQGFCDLLQLVWGEGFLRVQFGGSASDKTVKNDSRATGKDRYRNRATELFFIGKQFLLGRQIYGVDSKLAQQLTTRGYTTMKGGKGLVLQVEPKKQYKARMGFSPDEADATFVMLDLCRSRHFLVPSDPVPARAQKEERSDMIRFPVTKLKRNLRQMGTHNFGHDPHLV
jgi:hypothetical protein